MQDSIIQQKLLLPLGKLYQGAGGACLKGEGLALAQDVQAGTLPHILHGLQEAEGDALALPATAHHSAWGCVATKDEASGLQMGAQKD